MLEPLPSVFACAVIVANLVHRRGSLLRVVYIGHSCATPGYAAGAAANRGGCVVKRMKLLVVVVAAMAMMVVDALPASA
jgi:hypothetical protein